VSEQDDKVFLNRFSMVVAGLVVFAIAIILLAIEMDERIVGSDNPSQETAKVERIQPVFAVYTGESGRAAAQAAARAEEKPPAAEQESPQVAFGGSLDGEMIYNNACQACHMAGAAGAPQLVAEQWQGRIEQGVDTLVSHAINGYNAMPAKGGRMDLSDEQVRVSVEYMLEQIQ